MLKHNTYFEGGVQSVGFERNGLRATVGVMAPGEYRFTTDAAERMTVVSGALEANVGGTGWRYFPAGSAFEIAASTAMDVRPIGGSAAYLCEFLA